VERAELPRRENDIGLREDGELLTHLAAGDFVFDLPFQSRPQRRGNQRLRRIKHDRVAIATRHAMTEHALIGDAP
jgi:hypothetical protein